MVTTRTSAAWTFEAIGTTWTVETEAPLPDTVRGDIAGLIDDFDRAWSRFRDDSAVTRLASSGGRVPSPPDAEAMLSLYDELDRATGGAVNPLVGDSLARLGYDARYSLVAGVPQGAPEQWRKILAWTDETMTLREPASIDVGALGKGRLVDLVFHRIRGRVPGDITVDASGDLVAHGATQRVGLEHPFRPGQAIGVIEVTDAALCASAVTRRAWGDGLHHVLDARTGMPVEAYVATWVTAPTAMLADGLATALFFDGGPELAAAKAAQWVRMRTDGRVEWSPGCTAELFS
ncbi:FAD:protein FMN transferase [Microbacterium sp. RD1]|uniref:FAD:protein FMN transferase n=1 Tax=Microbacterium sp. RD1 TaxID=3457313 RepID=UPI003FA5A763